MATTITGNLNKEAFNPTPETAPTTTPVSGTPNPATPNPSGGTPTPATAPVPNDGDIK